MNKDLIESLINSVPLIKLKPINGNYVHCMMEKFNVTGSIKVKTVYQILKDAISNGKLDCNRLILEASSGNTAIALAFFSKVFNFKVKLILPKTTASCKKKLIKSYGAEVVEIDGITDDCIKYRDSLYKNNPEKYFMPDQFANYSNFFAHYNMTGPYIYNNLKQIDFFAAGLGTSGTVLGVGKYLKEMNPKIKIIAINPIEKIEGLRNFKTSKTVIPFYEEYKTIIDEVIDVDFNQSIEGVDYYLREGYFNGISSGAIIAGLKQYLQNHKGLVGATIAPDGGDYYFETLIKYINLKQYRGCR